MLRLLSSQDSLPSAATVVDMLSCRPGGRALEDAGSRKKACAQKQAECGVWAFWGLQPLGVLRDESLVLKASEMRGCYRILRGLYRFQAKLSSMVYRGSGLDHSAWPGSDIRRWDFGSLSWVWWFGCQHERLCFQVRVLRTPRMTAQSQILQPELYSQHA